MFFCQVLALFLSNFKVFTNVITKNNNPILVQGSSYLTYGVEGPLTTPQMLLPKITYFRLLCPRPNLNFLFKKTTT